MRLIKPFLKNKTKFNVIPKPAKSDEKTYVYV